MANALAAAKVVEPAVPGSSHGLAGGATLVQTHAGGHEGHAAVDILNVGVYSDAVDAVGYVCPVTVTWNRNRTDQK